MIDVAHLVEYVMYYDFFEPPYDGYKSNYLEQINYIYLGYGNWFKLDGVKRNDLKLFEISDDGTITTINDAIKYAVDVVNARGKDASEVGIDGIRENPTLEGWSHIKPETPGHRCKNTLLRSNQYYLGTVGPRQSRRVGPVR